jgi:hypothetical protein
VSVSELYVNASVSFVGVGEMSLSWPSSAANEVVSSVLFVVLLVVVLVLLLCCSVFLRVCGIGGLLLGLLGMFFLLCILCFRCACRSCLAFFWLYLFLFVVQSSLRYRNRCRHRGT